MTKQLPRPITVTAWAGFVFTVIAANWALERYGIIEMPLLGVSAPAGVYFAGLAFGLRDILHETTTRPFAATVSAVATGTVIAYLIGDGFTAEGGVVPIAVASAAAFLVSEMADFGVYSKMRETSWTLAGLLSNIAGAVIDSVVFLVLAFGTLTFISGQVVGKVAMTAVALPLLWATRKRLDV